MCGFATELDSPSAPCRTPAVTAHAYSLTGIRLKFTSLPQPKKHV